MELKLVGYKSRYIGPLQKIVKRDEVFTVSDEMGESLLLHNTKNKIAFEKIIKKQTKK